jgi:hypothetical protein
MRHVDGAPVELLVAAEQPPARLFALPGELVVRGSTSPAGGRAKASRAE